MGGYSRHSIVPEMEQEEKTENSAAPAVAEEAASCALCGCSAPAVRCDRCGRQTFCLSCDDMYHKHPKRRLHLRRAVDSIWNSGRSPRLRRPAELLAGDPARIPIPPPRSKKQHRVGRASSSLLRPHHELGSFGHSKVDMRSISPRSRDIFAGQKSPMNVEATYENDSNLPPTSIQEAIKANDIYENENLSVSQAENGVNSNTVSHSLWDLQRTNISSPIQVAIPSNSPDLMTNGQSFGFPVKPQSRSTADLSGAHPSLHHPHFPYLAPTHPSYAHSMTHLNCPQCVSPWANVMSPHPSPFVHPVAWGPPAARGHHALSNGRHSHGNLAYMDSNFHFPYPGAPFFPNGAQGPAPDAPRERRDSQGSRRGRGSREDASSPDTPSGPTVRREVEEEKMEEGEGVPSVPRPPSEPWSCVHCTFINPPGIHVCQVCCKTSFGASGGEQPDTDPRMGSDSPELVNLDALPEPPAPPGLARRRTPQQVI